MINPICLALDCSTKDQAIQILQPLEEHLGLVKIGLQLFTAVGPEILKITKLPVFLDLKLHDIPETVERTVKVARDLGVKYLSLHCQQSQITLERAVKQAGDLTLVGVSVLTSDTQADLTNRGVLEELPDYVSSLIGRGQQAGLYAFVCSPQEVRAIRKQAPNSTLITPGIRIADVQDDQKRIGTPKQAIQDGADILVIGRPIREAKDSVATLQQILKDLDEKT